MTAEQIEKALSEAFKAWFGMRNSNANLRDDHGDHDAGRGHDVRDHFPDVGKMVELGSEGCV